MSLIKMKDTKDWTLQTIWNETVLSNQYPMTPRNTIRASEIGTSMVDRYYKMQGVEPTNPFEARVLRIFECGNIFEWVAGNVLKKAGLFISEQGELSIPETEQHLKITGHYDFIAGGEPRWNNAHFSDDDLPASLKTIGDALVKDLREKYPDGMKKMVYEIKTVNSLVFWRHNDSEEGMTAYDHHQLQLYTYLKALGLDEGRILYISKDDLTLAEVAVIADDEMEQRWLADVMTMTKFYREKTLPPVPPEIVYDPAKRKFRTNWHVQRSLYFDKIVPDMEKDKWEAEIKKLESRVNYRVKKALEKKPDLTDDQIEYGVMPYIKEELATIHGNGNLIKK